MTATLRHDAVVDHRAGEAGAAIVEHAHDVAVADAAPRRVGRIDADRLAAADLAGLRDRARIHLAVQAMLPAGW